MELHPNAGVGSTDRLRADLGQADPTDVRVLSPARLRSACGTAEPPRAVFLREGVPRAMRATRWSPELAASVFISLGYG